jgi:hypothetical protein
MKNPETKLKEKVFRDLLTLKKSWWEKIQQVSIRGTPDIIGCIGPYFVALELKSKEEYEADPLQAFKLQCIRECGSIACVVTPESWPFIFRKLQKILGK